MTDTSIDDLPYAYLTTTGRITGSAHRIEIWFARRDAVVYLLAGDGDRSDWVRNLLVSPIVVLEIGDRKRTTRGRVIERGSDEDAVARAALLEKYQPLTTDDLSSWGRTALAVAIDWPADAPTEPSP